MVQTSHFTIYQGATASGRLYALDDDGTALNLSGLTGRGTAKYSYSASGILFDLNPQVHSSFTSGIIDWVVPYTGTTGCPITRAYYDIEVYNATVVKRVFEGRIILSPNVTI